MAVHGIATLNAKAKEHTEWAIDWLNANDIPATIEQRGAHPYFLIERFGNKRKVTFSSSPSVIQPNAVFRDVRIAALELGYDEKVDREGRRVGAFAALAGEQPPATDVKSFKGVVIPDFPEQFRDIDKRKLSQNEEYMAYVKERIDFVANVYTRPGVTATNIFDALVKAGHDLKTVSVISNDILDITTGRGQAERTKERKELGLVKPRGSVAERLPSTGKVPKVTINAIGLLIEEAAKNRLADLYTVRDNLKADADSFDAFQASMKKTGSQLETLLGALAQ